MTARRVPTGWKVRSGYLSVQRWQTWHNWLEITRYEVLSFRGVELDIMTKKDEIGYSSVRYTGHNRLEITNSEYLLFKGNELDIIVNEKVRLDYLSVQRWLTGHNSKRKGETWLSVGSEVINKTYFWISCQKHRYILYMCIGFYPYTICFKRV